MVLTPSLASAAPTQQTIDWDDVQAAVQALAGEPLSGTPRSLRRQAVDLLLPVAVTAPHPSQKQHVLDAALVMQLYDDTETLFVDEGRVTSGAVLDHDVQLIRQLVKLLKGGAGGDDERAAYLQGLLLLLRGARHLAELHLSDAGILYAGALLSGDVPKEETNQARAWLGAAENRFESGMRALGQGDPDQATRHFEKSWDFSHRLHDLWSVDLTGDADADGLLDILELRLGTSLFLADSDGDGLSDAFEAEWLIPHALPTEADTDGDGTADGDEDLDLDGLTNLDEQAAGTDPLLADSDHDDLDDAFEVADPVLDPLDPDTDDDALLDGDEIAIGANPGNVDTDSDGILDNEDTFDQSLAFPELGLELDLVAVGNQQHHLTAQGLDAPSPFSDVPGRASDFIFLTSTQPVEHVRLRLAYDSALLPGNAADLRLVRYDFEAGELSLLPNGSVDELDRVVYGDSTELGAFGVLHLPTWQAVTGLPLANASHATGHRLASLSQQADDPTPTIEPTEPVSPTPTVESTLLPPTQTPMAEPSATASEEPVELAPTLTYELGEQPLQLFAVDPSATAIPGEDVLIAAGDSQQVRPELVHNPVAGNYLVVWTDDAGEGAIYGRLHAESGQPLGESFLIAAGQVDSPFWARLIHNPTQDQYLLLWSELNGEQISQPFYTLNAYNLYALILGPDGLPTAAAPTLVTDQLTFFDIRPAYAAVYRAVADEYILAWEQPPGRILGNIAHPHRAIAQKLTANGQLVGSPTVVEIGVTTSIALAYAATSDRLMLSWDRFISGTNGYEIVAERLNPDSLASIGGTVFLTNFAIGWQGNHVPIYNSGADEFLYVFEDTRPALPPPYVPDTWGLRVAPDAAVQGFAFPILEADEPNARGDGGYSPLEDRFLVVSLPGVNRLFGQYVDPGGTLDGEPFRISELLANEPRAAARLSDTPGVPAWAVVWSTDGDIYGRWFPVGAPPSGQDSDFDGLTDEQELRGSIAGFNPTVFLPTDPFRADSDGDGLIDPDEFRVTLLDPIKTYPVFVDSDSDGLEDFVEVREFVDVPNRPVPWMRDTDGDTIRDGDEVIIFGTDPTLRDTDGDGFRDDFEINFNLDPLMFTEVMTELKSIHEFLEGAIYGEFGLDIDDNGNLPYFLGLLTSGLIGAIPGPLEFVGALADLRDTAAALGRGSIPEAALNFVGLLPLIGDAVDIPGTVGRFLVRHSDLAARVTTFVAHMDEAPQAIRIFALFLAWGDEVRDGLRAAGFADNVLLRMAREGIDGPALFRALRDFPEGTTLTRFSEFVSASLDDDVGGVLVHLRGLQVADGDAVRGYASNVKAAYGEWFVESARQSEGWQFLIPRSRINAAGYDMVVESGGVVRLIEVKSGQRLSVEDLQNYFRIDANGVPRLNNNYLPFRRLLESEATFASAARAGKIEVEIAINGPESFKIADQLRGVLGSPTLIKYQDEATGAVYDIRVLITALNQ